VGKREDPAALLATLLSTQGHELSENEAGARLGRDPEHLHRMRVATRRARTGLKTAKGMLEPERSSALGEELAWLGGVLGAVRDLDVLTARLRADGEGLDPAEQSALTPMSSGLSAERRKARAALTRALKGKRYRKLVDDLETLEAAAPQNGHVSLERRAEKQFARLAKSMSGLGDEATDDEIHLVRKRGKRARYAAELAAGSPSKALADFVRCAKAFQDVTGEHQDAVVAEEKWRALAADTGGATSFAAGRLVERERQRKEGAREQLPRAWRRLEKAGKRAWS
jgi:CHAD domain-containing protein